MNPAIQTQELTRNFGRVAALDALTLSVPEGAIFALIGPNGAGKTTTIQILMNIIRASSGQASVLGVDSSRLAGGHLEHIGYVSENQHLPDWMSVRYFLHYLARFYPSWDQALAQTMLHEFDLPLDRPLGKLSRGMRMKAALLSSLAYHPRLIVLDEPFDGLDPLVRDEVVEGLVQRAAGATILISSHDLAEMETFASHVAFLENGRLQFAEEIASLTGRFREIEVILDAPAPPLAAYPAHWLNVESVGHVLRFTDSAFQQQRTVAEIVQLFPAADPAGLSVRPLPLRDIFIRLARSSRKSRREN